MNHSVVSSQALAVTPPRSRRFTAIITVCSLMLLWASGLFGAAPARAHDELVGSTPGDHEVLETAPDQIELQFSDAPLDVGLVVEVRDAAGADHAVGAPEISGSTVTQPIDDSVLDGAYLVVWRVVSTDGHPISGRFAFAVGENGTEDLKGLDEVQAAAQKAAESQGEEASDLGEAATNTFRVVAGSIGALAAVALIIAVAWWFFRRMKHDSNEEDTETSFEDLLSQSGDDDR